MSWQARLEIYRKGFLDEVDAILGDQEDKEYRLRLAKEIDLMAWGLYKEIWRRLDAVEECDESVSEPD